jgi:GNAT superfamily N-acetyltransferase
MELNKSLYAKYLKEKNNINTLEDDKGFVSFTQQGPKGEEFYIIDIYIVPEYRRKGYATEVAKKLEKQARILGAKYLLGCIEPDLESSENSKNALESYGFEFSFYSESDGLDYYRKEI